MVMSQTSSFRRIIASDECLRERDFYVMVLWTRDLYNVQSLAGPKECREGRYHPRPHWLFDPLALPYPHCVLLQLYIAKDFTDQLQVSYSHLQHINASSVFSLGLQARAIHCTNLGSLSNAVPCPLWII